MNLKQAFQKIMGGVISQELVESFMDDLPAGLYAEVLSQSALLQGMDAERRKMWMRVAEFRQTGQEDAEELGKQYNLVAMYAANQLASQAIEPADWLAIMFTAWMMYYTGIIRLTGSQITPQILRGMVKDHAAWKRFYADVSGVRDPITGQVKYPSQKQIENRARLYKGDPMGLLQSRIELGYGDNWGWVFQYVPMDDDETCSACEDAAGYYLPGTGPMPGVVCFARERCRCKRVRVYNPVEFDRLRGAVSAEWEPGLEFEPAY